jgi:hypothetical protein
MAQKKKPAGVNRRASSSERPPPLIHRPAGLARQVAVVVRLVVAGVTLERSSRLAVEIIWQ